ncbi:MAG TPA: hypothetical protein VIY73_21285 [Polyangiaceae bacterium]
MQRLPLALCLGLAACGLGREGLGPAGLEDAGRGTGGGHEASTSDGGAVFGDDSGGVEGSLLPDVGVGPDAASSCTVPAGWQPVLFELSRGPCPAGSGASNDEVLGATAPPAACACPCAVTTQPTCDEGTLASRYSQGPPPPGVACPSQGLSLPVNGPGCMAMSNGGQLGGGFSADAIQPTGAACSSTLTPDPSQVTKTQVRTCEVPSSQADSVCTAAPPSGFSACVESAGDVACPPGVFSSRAVADDDEILVCPPCGTCQVGSTCNQPTVTFYGDPNCKTMVATFGTTGVCEPTGPKVDGQYVSSYEYSVQPQATCQPAAGGNASFNPVGPHTVCCR